MNARRPVLLAAAVLVAACGGGEDALNGPPVSVGVNRNPGQEWKFGAVVVYNEGSEPLRLEDARLLGLPDAVRVNEVTVLGPARPRHSYVAAPITIHDRAPYEHHIYDELVLAPRSTAAGKRGAELEFWLDNPVGGRFETRGAEVDYKVGDKLYHRHLDVRLAICVGTISPVCRPPAQGAKPE